jgi:hypothetical protein
MAFRIGIGGLPNSGKSFSRRTIPDGENVVILAPSLKATHLVNSDGKASGVLNFKGTHFKNWDEASEYFSKVSGNPIKTKLNIVQFLMAQPPTKRPTRENFEGSIVIVKNIDHLKHWLNFVSQMMPWVHTVILPDLTHFISEVISEESFIQRKAGGDAFQKFWELGGSTLRNILLHSDYLRDDLIVITEYHTVFSESENNYQLYVPAGKMLTEKFKPESYYDVFLFTDVQYGESGRAEEYRFLTEANRTYPNARSMGIFNSQYIPNDLKLVLRKVREYLGMPIPESWKS